MQLGPTQMLRFKIYCTKREMEIQPKDFKTSTGDVKITREQIILVSIPLTIVTSLLLPIQRITIKL